MIFRPSCIVNFVLSFDESLTLAALPPPASVDGFVEKPPNQSSVDQGKPIFFQSSGRNKSFLFGKVPRSGEVELPGYRQAGSFHMSFDYLELPIDPRCVRSAAVEIHLGTVSHQDFANGFKGRNSDGSLSSILVPRDNNGSPNSSTLVAVCTVDEWNTRHHANGSELTVSGRDLRGMLLDTPIGIVPGAVDQLLDQLDMNWPINEIVKEILRFHPMFQDFHVEINSAEWKDGVVPSPGNSDVLPRHRLPARAHKVPPKQKVKIKGKITSKAGSNDLSFWDLIVRMCFMVGAIPYFRGVTLWIRPARSIFDQARVTFDPTKNPTPFAGGLSRRFDLVSGVPLDTPLQVRRLVYGRDVTEFGFDRKFAGFHRPRIVRIVGYDPSSPNGERVVQAQWPRETDTAAKVTKVSPGGQQAQEEILNIPVNEIKDQSQLEEIAQGVYEEIARGEIGGTIETCNLTSFGGDNTDPDLLRLAPGDGVELLIDTRALNANSPLVSTLTDLNRKSFSEAAAALTPKVGNDYNLASAIIATQRGAFAELQQFFRVANVRYTISTDSVKIGFDYQNYIVPRNQVQNATTLPGTITRLQVPDTGTVGTTPAAGPQKGPGLKVFSGRR